MERMLAGARDWADCYGLTATVRGRDSLCRVESCQGEVAALLRRQPHWHHHPPPSHGRKKQQWKSEAGAGLEVTMASTASSFISALSWGAMVEGRDAAAVHGAADCRGGAREGERWMRRQRQQRRSGRAGFGLEGRCFFFVSLQVSCDELVMLCMMYAVYVLERD